MKYHNLKIVPLLITAFIVFDEVAISFNSALLPNIKTHFSITSQEVQLSLSLGLFALGFAGLVYGGLADIFGRRPMLLVSIILFSTMTLASALAPTTELFLLSRFLQGLGAGAGWVVGNSCLNDIYKGKQYAKIMNYVHAIAGITPAIAPIIGSYLGVIIGWRACFIIVFILTAILAIVMYLFQAETLAQKKTFIAKDFINNYWTIFHSKIFIKYTIVKVITVMMIFTEIANIPLIFINYLGVTPEYYGFYMFPVFFCYMLAATFGAKYVEKHDTDTLLKFGILLLFASNTTIAVLLNLGFTLSVLSILFIKSFTYIGWGVIFGNATAEIVSSVPGKAGVASAIMIAFEMLFSSLGIYGLGFFFDGSMLPLSIFLSLSSVFAAMPLLYRQDLS